MSFLRRMFIGGDSHDVPTKPPIDEIEKNKRKLAYDAACEYLKKGGHKEERIPALVEMLFLIDKPRGRKIVDENTFYSDGNVERKIWIRLENGLLLKEVKDNEFKVIEHGYWQCISSECVGKKSEHEKIHANLYEDIRKYEWYY